MDTPEKLYTPSAAATEALQRIELEGADAWGLRCDIANSNSDYSKEITDVERFALSVYGLEATPQRVERLAEIEKSVQDAALNHSPIIVIKGEPDWSKIQFARVRGINFFTIAAEPIRYSDEAEKAPDSIYFDILATEVLWQLMSHGSPLEEAGDGERHETGSGLACKPNDAPTWLTFMCGSSYPTDDGKPKLGMEYDLWEGAGPTLPIINSYDRLQEFVQSSPLMRDEGSYVLMSALRAIAHERRVERGVAYWDDELCKRLKGENIKCIADRQMDITYIPSEFDTTNPDAFKEIGKLLFDKAHM